MGGRTVTRVWKHDPALYAPSKYRKACKYHAFIPDRLADLELVLDARTVGAVSDAENAIRDLDSVAHPVLTPMARLLLRTESIASSKVEGLQVDVRDLARTEARAETGRKTGAAAMEVLANIDAMQLAVDDATSVDPFSVGEIIAIHRELMANAPNARIAGRIRTDQNWIGGNDYNPCGADFVPPPPEHIGDLLEDLCRAINDDALPPIVQAALVHAQFETLHPFDDGNGRTGRALIHVVLRRRGMAPSYVPPISVILASDRERYIDGLIRFRGEDPTRWIEQFSAAAVRAARLAAAYVEAVEDLMEKWRERLDAGHSPRADAAEWTVLESLPAHPVITAPVAAAATGRARSAIHRALGTLEDAGVLAPLSRSRRNRSWEAVGLLDLIAGLEAGEMPELREEVVEDP